MPFLQGQALTEWADNFITEHFGEMNLRGTTRSYYVAKITEAYLRGGIDALRDEAAYLSASRAAAERERKAVRGC
jgi:hypothetical protein